MAVDIVARLKLAGGQFATAIDSELSRVGSKIDRAGAQWKSNLKSHLGSSLTGILAGVTIAGITEAVRSSLDYASSLGEVAQQLGVTTSALQFYRYAATQTGIEQETMDSALQRLTRTMGTAPDKIEKLGISLRDANGSFRDAGDILPDIAEKIKGMNAAGRAAVEVALFGKAGQQLDTLLSEGAQGVNALRSAYDQLGIAMSDEQIQRADETADKIAAIKMVVDQQMAQAVADNADAILSVAEALPKLVDEARAALGPVRDLFNALDYWHARINAAAGGFAEQTGFDLGDAAGNAVGAVRSIERGVRLAQAEQAARLRRATGPVSDGGSSRSRRGGGSGRSRGESDAQREAERLAKERARTEERLRDFIRDQLAAQSDAARIESIRVEKGERAADLARVEADFLRQHPEAAAATVAEFARLAELAPPITAADRARLQALMDQLKVVRDQTVELERQRGITEDDAAKRAATADRQKAEFEETQAKLRDLREEEKRRAEDQLATLADYYEGLFSGRSGDIWKDFKAQGIRVLAELAAQWTLGQLSGLGSGNSPTSLVAGLFSSSGSGSSQKAGGAGGFGGIAGGILGGVGGQATSLFKSIGLSPGLSSALGPAAIAGGAMLAISLLGGALSPTKKGSASLNFADGQLGVGATAGNSKSRIAAAKSAVGSLAGTLSDIADALDGEITGAGSVSIGKRGKKFTVDTTGANRTKGAGVLKFKSEEEAIRAALEDALKDGVIGAISEASRRILASGKDLQKSIEKAALIESIPKALKARLDPVGAALDAVNDKWEKVIAALNEGGASAEQMADAQKLYRMELDDARTSAQAASATLKDFLQSLGVGAASPLSLRAQESGAAAALRPFLESIDAGRTIDQQAYQAAAQQFLDIERQINASGPAFFAEFDKIRDYTSRAISSIDNATTLTPARDLFAEKTASSTQATAEILAEHTGQLTAIKNYLGQIAAGGGAAGGFIGAGRGFA